MITSHEHQDTVKGLFDYIDPSGTTHEIEYIAILREDGRDEVTAEPVTMWDGWGEVWEDVQGQALEHAYKEINKGVTPHV